MKKLANVILVILIAGYTINAQTWVQRDSFRGAARYSAIGFSIGNKGYIGLGINSSLTKFNDFWEWNQANNVWTRKTDFPGIARESAAAFSIGKKGYIATGDTTKELWEWDGDTLSVTYNTWTRKANFRGIGRTVAVAFSIGKKGYVGIGDYQQDFWEWEGDTSSSTYNTWTRKADFGGGGRGWATGFSIGTKGYIGTGTDGSNFRKDFWEWDGDTLSATYNMWTRKTDVPGGARTNARGFSIGNKGYIGMGLDSTGYINLQDFWQWDPVNNSWTHKLNFGGTGRQSSVGFSIGNRGYIGTEFDNSHTKDFWEYCDSICSSIGIEKQNLENIISIYPNPVSNNLFIDLPENKTGCQIILFDVYGKEVKEIKIDKQRESIQIDISYLAEGIYFLYKKKADGVLTKKVIVQH